MRKYVTLPQNMLDACILSQTPGFLEISWPHLYEPKIDLETKNWMEVCRRSLGTSRSEIVLSVLNILGTCLCCQMQCFICYGKSFWIHFYVPQLDLEVKNRMDWL